MTELPWVRADDLYGPRVGAGVVCHLDPATGRSADVYLDTANPGGVLIAVDGKLAALPPAEVASLLTLLAPLHTGG